MSRVIWFRRLALNYLESLIIVYKESFVSLALFVFAVCSVVLQNVNAVHSCQLVCWIFWVSIWKEVPTFPACLMNLIVCPVQTCGELFCRFKKAVVAAPG